MSVITSAVSDQSCRGFLRELDQSGELLVVKEPVAPVHDLSALMSLVDERAAVRFDDVVGSDMPVFGGLLSSLDRVSSALRIPKSEIQTALVSSVTTPVAPVVVERAAVQEVEIKDGVLEGLPIPTFFAKETGPYVSAGLIVARDPETGRGNASYARLKVLGPNEALIGIAPNHHLAVMAAKAAAKGEALPFAVVLGAHPAIQIAACLYLGYGDDEMHCAGSLLGEPVRLARCRTSDVLVPADAEIVLEGLIHGDERIPEGLVSEFHGMYEDYGTGQRATFTRRTQRKAAMFQVIEPGFHKEHLYLGGIAIAASLRAVLTRSILNVGEVAVTVTGGGRTNVVVQIASPRPGQARRAMAICWGAVSLVKTVTIVDADVDPWDCEAVEVARLTRMRIERDLLIVTDLPADRSEPLESGGVVTKIGYDATIRPEDRKEGFDKAVPPDEAYARMRAVLGRLRPDFVA